VANNGLKHFQPSKRCLSQNWDNFSEKTGTANTYRWRSQVVRKKLRQRRSLQLQDARRSTCSSQLCSLIFLLSNEIIHVKW